MKALYVGNDNQIKLSGLLDSSTGDYVNDATVTMTLVDSDDEEVSGQSWPSTLDHVTDSDGEYEGILEDGLDLTEGDKYTLTIDVDAGNDNIAKFSVAMRAMRRYT